MEIDTREAEKDLTEDLKEDLILVSEALLLMMRNVDDTFNSSEYKHNDVITIAKAYLKANQVISKTR